MIVVLISFSFNSFKYISFTFPSILVFHKFIDVHTQFINQQQKIVKNHYYRCYRTLDFVILF